MSEQTGTPDGAVPTRVQLRRTKGWRKPDGVVVVARPSKWGNPYTVTEHGVAAVDLFERELRDCIARPWAAPHDIQIRVIAESIEELRGRDLACWCAPGAACHADVLLDLANAGEGKVATRDVDVAGSR